ncbi:MAG: hypothetical protein AAGB32_00675 [Pseudomonadota bacterium]
MSDTGFVFYKEVEVPVPQKGTNKKRAKIVLGRMNAKLKEEYGVTISKGLLRALLATFEKFVAKPDVHKASLGPEAVKQVVEGGKIYGDKTFN